MCIRDRSEGKDGKGLLPVAGEYSEQLHSLGPVSYTHLPARLIGVFGKKGSIEPGKDADLVVLDRAWNVRRTIVAGESAVSYTHLWPPARG